MKFSVVIPTRNQARFIRSTLASALSQEDVECEILVFDGDSDDGTRDILREYEGRIQWVSRPDRGQTDAINQGLRAATGDILCYLNSDDILYPGALARVAGHFGGNPRCRILYGNADHLHGDGTFMERYYNEEWNYDRLLEVCYICQPAAFWRRTILEDHGYFDESLRFAMDYDYWLRVGRHEPFHYLSGSPLAGSRLHAESKTLSSRIPVHREILKVVRRYTPKPYRWLHVLSRLLEEQDFQGTKPEETRRPTIRYFSNLFVLAREHDIEFDEFFIRKITLEMAKTFLPATAAPSKSLSTRLGEIPRRILGRLTS